MTTRLLPPAEWSRLAETDGGHVWPLFDPLATQVFVVEQEGRIVGRLAVFTIRHADSWWIDPAYRGRVSVCRHLWKALNASLLAGGYQGVVVTVFSEQMRRLLSHAGATELPGTHYVWDLTKVN